MNLTPIESLAKVLENPQQSKAIQKAIEENPNRIHIPDPSNPSRAICNGVKGTLTDNGDFTPDEGRRSKPDVNIVTGEKETTQYERQKAAKSLQDEITGYKEKK